MIDSAKYAKSHEYAKVDGDVATVGISDFAQVRDLLNGAVWFQTNSHTTRQLH